MSQLDTMIRNMTTYLYIPPMTVTQAVKVEKTDDVLMWENGAQVCYTDTVIINGGTKQCVIVNGIYNMGLSVTSTGIIRLSNITIPENSSLMIKTDKCIMITNSMIQGTIDCVGGNPGVIVDLMTICQSKPMSIPLLSTVSIPLTFTTAATSQTLQLPSCPESQILLYGFTLPDTTTPIIILQWNKTLKGKPLDPNYKPGWTVSSYDTTLLKSCTITSPHTLELTWAKDNGVTQLNHHFL